MTSVTAFSILFLTVGLSLSRPRLGNLRIYPPIAAMIGAALMMSAGLVSVHDALATLSQLFHPILTIVSLMVITLIAEQAGLFDVASRRLAVAAAGDARKLFASLFFTGTLVGMVFTNDAAVLIFTPLVFNLLERVAEPSWKLENKVPFYFGVLYIGNLVGALVISNPINIIVSSFFGVGFAEYARWMMLPALASMVVSYAGLRWYFRRDIPHRFLIIDLPSSVRDRFFAVVCCAVLFVTLAGFFSEHFTGWPTWVVALGGAIALLILHAFRRSPDVRPIIRAVGWDAVIFVCGIFIVAVGLKNAGLAQQLGNFIVRMGHGSLPGLTLATGMVAGVCSAVMNNHPTAGIMTHAINALHLAPVARRSVVFSALMGGDLGPKMLPIGSLADLMWFRMLRNRGVQIPVWLCMRVGVPVTMAALLVSLLILNGELYVAFH